MLLNLSLVHFELFWFEVSAPTIPSPVLVRFSGVAGARPRLWATLGGPLSPALRRPCRWHPQVKTASATCYGYLGVKFSRA